MILVTGGAFQGKRQFVKERFHIAEAEMADPLHNPFADCFTKKAVAGMHQYIKILMEEEGAAREAVEQLIEQNPECIIIADEIGCGLVPVDAFERHYREETGRILCMAAREAAEVYRLHCGIPVKIK